MGKRNELNVFRGVGAWVYLQIKKLKEKIRVRVPIISPATSPSLSVKENPFFIRGALPSSSQTRAIAAIVKNYNWREVVVIYEESPYGTGILPYLTDALLEINTLVSYRSGISPSANDDQILRELYKLKTMQTRVFIVHLQENLASRFFLKAKEAGMMNSGYAWIITDVLTSLLDLVDTSVIESSMQGVLGLKSYVPKSKELDMFTRRWRKRFRQEYPDMDQVELNVFGLWAYESITLLAEAVEKVGTTAIPKLKKPDTRENITDLDALGTSEVGSLLIDSMQNTELKSGLSGDFCIVDRELQPSPYQIVNIIGKGDKIIGFWTEKDGILHKLKMNVERDPTTQAVIATGLGPDVFKEVIQSLKYAVPYEFIPFPIAHSPTSQNYDDLVHKITSKEYDAVVGVITILASRSEYVDFTLPFSESSISAVVPVRNDDRKNAWIFLKPLKAELWIATGALFVFIGFVVWALEHRVNKDFRGPKRKQVGMIFWFSFSTLVFAHKEKITSNLSRFVLIVWVFVVLVLTSSYTASLTSMLTVQQLQPTITDLNDLIKNGEYVGYQKGSFVKDVLTRMKFDSSKFRSCSTLEEYNDALSRGSKNGGVGAIVDELPYLRLLLNKYCRKYIMVGPTYKAASFGFAFPKGSPLVPDVSRAVLKVIEGETMNNIIQKWFGNETDCPKQDGMAIASSLTLDSFKGLFLIAGVSAGSALPVFFVIFLYQNRVILATDDSIGKKLCAIAKVFDLKRDDSNSMSKNLPLQSPEIGISDGLGESPASEGFSTTETGTPVHETMSGTIEERLHIYSC
ncbi:hypothetical protein MTR67_028347 [Solanum verrucosum]|uniref:Glutamate receptor n=1 Tax=Solanum verrucosum TaxID=315347 RepID=A0AAF0R2C2_SOLVR|nr:hypothetical protein MTR67_028347 [Solanum verrucosum]